MRLTLYTILVALFGAVLAPPPTSPQREDSRADETDSLARQYGQASTSVSPEPLALQPGRHFQSTYDTAWHPAIASNALTEVQVQPLGNFRPSLNAVPPSIIVSGAPARARLQTPGAYSPPVDAAAHGRTIFPPYAPYGFRKGVGAPPPQGLLVILPKDRVPTVPPVHSTFLATHLYQGTSTAVPAQHFTEEARKGLIVWSDTIFKQPNVDFYYQYAEEIHPGSLGTERQAFAYMAKQMSAQIFRRIFPEIHADFTKTVPMVWYKSRIGQAAFQSKGEFYLIGVDLVHNIPPNPQASEYIRKYPLRRILDYISTGRWI
ncbi:uncharacterized protein UTRI_06214 [Ustilago trichophora]|uniref:Effector family protein Eff1 n=1 Tax=Ustilago trichophora TaxID=86804 RepID=A0A5C3EGR5_9BASI|nr:uncharacterized protein UTRI_06214 [Ustilago trichophora]